MTKAMETRVAAVDYQGNGVVISQPVPEVLPGHVRIEVKAASISPGTEMSVVRLGRNGDFGADQPPRPIGYQAAGVVAEVSEGVTHLQVGQRVMCFGAGRARIAEQIVVPQNLCCALPDGVSYPEAAFANLVLTALHAVRRAEARLGENLLVVGAGLVGQLTSQFGRMAGMNVMLWDKLSQRLALAEQCGVDATVNVGDADPVEAAQAFTEGFGFDSAIIAFGGNGDPVMPSVLQCMKQTPDTHRQGRVVLVGVVSFQMSGGANLSNIDIVGSARTGPGYHDKQWEAGLSNYPPVYVRWDTQTNLRWAAQQIARKRLQVEPLITHRLQLDDFGKAIDLLADRPNEALGVVFEF